MWRETIASKLNLHISFEDSKSGFVLGTLLFEELDSFKVKI
jgi:hypothetical protein